MFFVHRSREIFLVWCVVWMHGNMFFSVIKGDLSIICSGKTLCEIFCRFWLWAYTTGHCVDITCVSASKWLCLPGVHNTSLWTARVPLTNLQQRKIGV